MSHTPLFERRGKMPAESLVYRDWKSGLGRTQMAARYGVTEHGVREYLRRHMERWESHPPEPLADSDRKIVFTMTTVHDSTFRKVLISLPRISMHVRALEARA